MLPRVLARVKDREPQAASVVSGILAIGFGLIGVAGAADIIFLGRDRGSAGGESGRQHDCKKSKERRQPAPSTLRKHHHGPVTLPRSKAEACPCPRSRPRPPPSGAAVLH